MQRSSDYEENGYAVVRGLLAPEVCNAFLNQFHAFVQQNGAQLSQLTRTNSLLRREAVEMYGYHYPPMLTLLWGLTPVVARLAGRELLPSYSYFRIYREGDICRVHSDRPSCEHSMSLTLDYSDGVPWPLEVEQQASEPSATVHEDFAGARFAAIETQPGDAVLYRGVHRRHGRTTPNPNAWSAHLFLHWVERGGPFADKAFDGNLATTRPANFPLR
ncbi:hypothetical protein AB2M62_09425 [Sphingomonas sp. MMS12-HWE2-04]|uniref:hypothetical protein n=1 Tax=Sphingomonas sp. MMS12-HWE2-04 TaxID=3234199 RepID=UPI00384E2C5F